MKLYAIAIVVLILNIPFGYWRDNVEKFSKQWFLAVHAPVPAVVALRFAGGLGFHLITYPILIGSFFTGQLLGGKLHLRRKSSGRLAAGSCLLTDLFKKN
jgi:hypothetical protein